MKHVAKRLADISTEGIVTLAQLKKVNYPLYKYVQKNFNKVQQDLESLGILLFKGSIKQTLNRDQVISLVKYYYGNKVDMTHLIQNNQSLYRLILNIMDEKSLRNFLINAGFKVTNNYISQIDERYRQKLKMYADETGFIKKIDQRKCQTFYNSLCSRAKSRGMSLQEFIEGLGFTYGYDNLIRQMKRKGYSYKQIADKIGVSWMAVYYKCRKWRSQGEVFKDARTKTHSKK